jgi:hypothetical protein
VDAYATPFVQGQLRQETLSVRVATECAHCAQPIKIEIDSGLNCRLADAGCKPLVFVPQIDWGHFKAPDIIEAF